MVRYRRYKKFIKSSRGKWSPNIQEIGTTQVNAPPNATFYHTFLLSYNPDQDANTVSQKFTVKRIEVSFYIDKDETTALADLEDIAAYIMYVPQGINITENYNIYHPEYIMAYQFLGSPSHDGSHGNQQYQPRKISTRLSRKLNTGDSIILYVKGNNTSSSQGSHFYFHGLVRWWTKAN